MVDINEVQHQIISLYNHSIEHAAPQNSEWSSCQIAVLNLPYPSFLHRGQLFES
jgi:hypothetical protein